MPRWSPLADPIAQRRAIAIGLIALLAIFLDAEIGSDAPEFEGTAVSSSEPVDAFVGPFSFDPGRTDELERRARFGYSHVIYAKSPGGVIASARRTARHREAVEAAAETHEVSAELMEAIILLESAGRPQVIAGDDPEAASGLAQILASTATDLLGMRVDLERSRKLTRRLATNPKSRRLLERRARIDERFDPVAALDGMGRYLAIARERLGRDDLAIASYHMGIGNLSEVIRRYAETGSGSIAEVVAERDLSYARLFFDSSPLGHERAWSLLARFGDDSSTYYWRVLAAKEIMRLWRQDPEELERLDELQTAKSTAEEVFHPEEDAEIFEDGVAIVKALDTGTLVPIPEGSSFGYEISPQLGAEAEQLGTAPEIYRALRPEALATLTEIGGAVQSITGTTDQLTLTSAVRDESYQESLRGHNSEATSGFSLHTTGYAFDIRRDYENDRQARAFQFVLDRLRALAVIDYAVEPAAIHITASGLRP